MGLLLLLPFFGAIFRSLLEGGILVLLLYIQNKIQSSRGRPFFCGSGAGGLPTAGRIDRFKEYILPARRAIGSGGPGLSGVTPVYRLRNAGFFPTDRLRWVSVVTCGGVSRLMKGCLR